MHAHCIPSKRRPDASSSLHTAHTHLSSTSLNHTLPSRHIFHPLSHRTLADGLLQLPLTIDLITQRRLHVVGLFAKYTSQPQIPIHHLPVPCIQTAPWHFLVVAIVPHCAETGALGNVLVWGYGFELGGEEQSTYGDAEHSQHDAVGQEGFERDTHVGGGEAKGFELWCMQ
jgi:hypothetical protein